MINPIPLKFEHDSQEIAPIAELLRDEQQGFGGVRLWVQVSAQAPAKPQITPFTWDIGVVLNKCNNFGFEYEVPP